MPVIHYQYIILSCHISVHCTLLCTLISAQCHCLVSTIYTQVISLVTCWALMYGDKRMRIVTSNIHVIQDFERIIFQAKNNDTEGSNRTDIAYYYLSNLSIDRVAPKGIACTRVLPKTHTDIYITNTTKKTKTKLQNKNKL